MLFHAPALDSDERRVLGRIDEARESLRWQLHEPRRWLGSLRKLSFARNIQGSNSIEGYEAALDDAAAVVVGAAPLDADEETTEALEGYRDAMTFVLQLASEPDFYYSEQLLKSLHFMMTKHDLSNRPGRWRAGTIYVRREETGEILYEGPDRPQIPALIQDLVAELNDADDVPTLVRAAMAHLNLVMIHPFRDGNGRMARCLQSLVLARGGVLSPVFMSIEEYLGRNTPAYYEVLGTVGQGSWRPANDARPWLRFTLTAHLRQAQTMLRRVRESERLWTDLERLVEEMDLPERTTSLLYDAAFGLRVRNSTYRAFMAENGEEITEQTAGRDLRLLVAKGLLVARGQSRGRFYSATGRLIDLRRTITSSRNPRDDSDPFE
jgi:Fic family protein